MLAANPKPPWIPEINTGAVLWQSTAIHFYFMCIDVYPASISVQHAHVVPQEARRGY